MRREKTKGLPVLLWQAIAREVRQVAGGLTVTGCRLQQVTGCRLQVTGHECVCYLETCNLKPETLAFTRNYSALSPKLFYQHKPLYRLHLTISGYKRQEIGSRLVSCEGNAKAAVPCRKLKGL